MKRYLFILVCLTSMSALAQQDTAKAPPYGWNHSVAFGLTATEVSYSHWSQGGDNALAYGVSMNGKSVQDEIATNWMSEYKLSYGQTRLGDQGLRKTDDKIDIASVLTLKFNLPVNPYVSATFKTQFTRGYKYDNTGVSTAVSNFFDPAYLTQTAGMGYMPIPEVKLRLGAGLREILASQFAALYTDNPMTMTLEKTKVDGGLEFVTEVDWKIVDNIRITSKVELFDAFDAFTQVIVRSDNSLTMNISKYIVTIVNVQLINEKRVTPRTQVKQTLALGLTYTLI